MNFQANNRNQRPEREQSSRDMKLQDVFLNHCRREKIAVTIQLVDRSIKNGFIVGFDALSIILEEEQRQHLIYKNAIVAVNPQQQVNYIFNESYRNEFYRNDALKSCSEYTADPS
ncbi:MAG: RNA chaperone Hfq [Saccharofermentanales bacterium]|nr:RNA chaperone Hfq [Clostridiaceae bacterium]